MEVESTLARLREATAEINRATDDPQVRATLEKTWLLQDRLVFPQRVRCLELTFVPPTNSRRNWMPSQEIRSVHSDASNYAELYTPTGKPNQG